MIQAIRTGPARHFSVSTKPLLITGVLALGIATVVLVHRAGGFDLRWLASLGYLGAFFLPFLGSVTVALPVPGTTAIVATSAVLNPGWVAFAAAAGATLGMVPSYVIGRAGKQKVRRLAMKRGRRARRFYLKVDRMVKRRPRWVSFVLAVVPNPIFDFAGLIAGSADVPVRKFLPYTFLGRMVYSLAIAMIARGGLALFR